MTDEEIQEIVAWQMKGMLHRKAPTAKHIRIERCPLCHRDWHGLPRDGCPSPFDTPNTAP